MIVGIIAKLLHRGRDPGAGIFMSILGAIILLVISRAVAGRRWLRDIRRLPECNISTIIELLNCK